MCPFHTVDLGEDTVIELHQNYVITRISSLSSKAVREINQANIDEAYYQGYTADDYGVYCSLAEHIALHTLVARLIYKDKNSPIILESATGEGPIAEVVLPYWRRLHEEAIVIAIQYYLNTNDLLPPLDPWIVTPLYHNEKYIGTLGKAARDLREKLGLVDLFPANYTNKAKKTLNYSI